MPINDPADQHAAREVKTSIREAVKRGDLPPVELDWYLSLPDRIRNSAKVLQVALKHAEPLLKHARAAWNKEKATERARQERLAELRATPRQLDCLRSPDSPAAGAWQGVGCRKRRCRKFDAIGRAFTSRQGVTSTHAVPESSADNIYDIHSVKSPPNCLPKRPSTPEGLREAVWCDPQLRKTASRLYCNGYTTPRWAPPAPAPAPGLAPAPTPAPAPVPPAPVVICRPPSPLPPPQPPHMTETKIYVGGRGMDTHLAYLMAVGKWESCKWAPTISLHQGAKMVLDTDDLHPGVLAGLVDLLFPEGMNNLSLARPKFSYIKDFVIGWYALALSPG